MINASRRDLLEAGGEVNADQSATTPMVLRPINTDFRLSESGRKRLEGGVTQPEK